MPHGSVHHEYLTEYSLILPVNPELAFAHSASKQMSRVFLPHIVSEQLLVARNHIFQQYVHPSGLRYPCDRSEY